MYYNECKYCGANLDPGEKCDCQKEEIKDEATSPDTVAKQFSFNKDKLKFA